MGGGDAGYLDAGHSQLTSNVLSLTSHISHLISHITHASTCIPHPWLQLSNRHISHIQI